MNITQDDLLQYLYNEASPDKEKFIEEQLIIDKILYDRLLELKIPKDRLNKIKLISPDNRSVDSIFNYSQQGLVVETLL